MLVAYLALRWLSLFWYSSILFIKCINFFICLVLFLYGKTATIRNILFYVWLVPRAKDWRYANYFVLCVNYFNVKGRCFGRGCIGGVGLIRFQLFLSFLFLNNTNDYKLFYSHDNIIP